MEPDDVQLRVDSLDAQSRQRNFRPLLEGVRKVLASHGVHPDRIQIPMTQPCGFRHTTRWGVVLTWTRARRFDDTLQVKHPHAR
ncbi:MAG: hypothetical protein VX000_13860, partial [Myxococcota bacterium]|nr:hypothetical protein [Myxococcota bacterium]